jgi:hypothetical protein
MDQSAPGKFWSTLDRYVYQVSLDGGPDESVGSVSENGIWYGLMREGHTIFRNHDPCLETLTQEEGDFLRSVAGAIIQEDEYGFVTVDFFDHKRDLDRKWNQILNTFEGENEV